MKTPKKPALVRATALRGYAGLVARHGEAPERLARLADLPPVYFRHPEMYLHFASFARLLDLSARATGHRMLGAELGDLQGLSGFGEFDPGSVIPTGASLRQAIELLRESLLQHSFVSDLRLSRSGDHALLSIALEQPASPGDGQAIEHAVAAGIRAMKTFYGPSWGPNQVIFQHRGPAGTTMPDGSAHPQWCGVPARYGEGLSGFTFDAGLLDAPVPTSEAAESVPGASSDAKSAARPLGCSQQVEKLVRYRLSSGDLNLHSTARLLSVSPRTLQRQLMQEQSSFARMVDQVRRQLAEQYLLNGDLPLSQISALLGFTQLSNLSHAFQRWHGMSPSEWKRLSR